MTRLHRFPCGRVTVETIQQIDGVSITHSAGQLPDALRTMHYRPVVHPEFPDAGRGGGTDAGFAEFIAALRDASEQDASAIVAGAIR